MLAAAGIALATTEIFQAIKSLYGVASDFNDFINDHIDKMKAADNKTIARTGRILEGAKHGFLLGYTSSVVIIAAGQVILGNTLSGIATTATAATLTNPIAMTCAAVGAIIYGWAALSDTEREEILDKLSKGLQLGIELIKSLIRYVLERTKELLSAENLEEIKRFVSNAANTFGKPLGQITRKIADITSDNVSLVLDKAGEAVGMTKQAAVGAYEFAATSAGTASDRIVDTLGNTKDLAGDACSCVTETAKRITGKVVSKVKK